MSTDEIVYIIDDDPSMRSSLTNLTESAGLQARAYGTVADFLAALPEITAGCLILDVRLPDLNGLELQAQMGALGIRLPVILMTGHGDIPMTVRAMRAGAIDFLTKPFKSGEMLTAVARALTFDRHRRVGEAESEDVRSRYGSLSPREREVMALVTAGKMNKQAAGDLGLSEITVKVHRGSLMRKMGVRTLADLVRLAEQLGVPATNVPTAPVGNGHSSV